MIFISWNILVSLQVSPVALDNTYLLLWLGKAERHQRHKWLSCEVSVHHDTTFVDKYGFAPPNLLFFPISFSHKFFLRIRFFFIGLQHFHHPLFCCKASKCAKPPPLPTTQTACDSSPSPHPLILPRASDRAVYQAPPTLIETQKAPLTVSFNVTTVVNTPTLPPPLSLTPSKEPPRTTKR